MATFRPPTIHTGTGNDILFSRYRTPVGQSVVKVNGHYQTIQYPWQGQLNPWGAGDAHTGTLVEGTDYFLGGHVYTVTTAVAAALNADGYVTT